MTTSALSECSTNLPTTSCSRPLARALSCSATEPFRRHRTTWPSALERDAALLVYPGGDDETFRPSWESSTVDFAERTGFIKLALEHEVPIVPVVSIGGQETGLFLGRGRGLAKALSLDRMRLKVLPAVIGPPFGLTLLDLPVRLPLPAKISIRVMPPINLRERLGENADIEEGYKLIRATMQRMLTRLSNERTLPIVG